MKQTPVSAAMERWAALSAPLGDLRQRMAAMPAYWRSHRAIMAAGVGAGVLAAVVLWWAVAALDRSAERANARASERSVELALPPPALPPAADVAAPTEGPEPDVEQALPRDSDPLISVRPDPANSLTVPSVTTAAFAAIPLAAAEASLPPAPDPALVENTDVGPLPQRGADGRVAWRAYARPFAADDDRPRIAVIVTGLGLSDIATTEIIRRLPGAVTLAFEPAAADVDGWARAARAGGHEILLGLPQQGDDFPFVDRGPDALAPDLSPEQNRARLKRLLARMSGYVGVLSDAGGADEGAVVAGGWASGSLAAVDAELAERGLLMVDERGAGAGDAAAPRLRTDLSMTAESSVAAIRARLAALEALARSRTYAIAVVEPSPLAIAELSAWAATLAKKDLVLAPVSAVAETAGGSAR